MADTTTVNIPESFTGVYEKLKEKLLADTPKIDYTPRPRAELKAGLQAALRPQLEQNIAVRQKNTKANNAAIDADAGARGILNSSWVTDVKNRNLNNEAADIGSMKSSYGASLASSLASLIADQESKRLSVEQYNKGAEGSALSSALNLALQKYGEWGAAPAGGGGYAEPVRRSGGPKGDDDADAAAQAALARLLAMQEAAAPRKQAAQNAAANSGNKTVAQTDTGTGGVTKKKWNIAPISR